MADDAISDEQLSFFHENGYLILRGVLHQRELAELQAATDRLISKGLAGTQDPDFMYGVGQLSGSDVLRRVEYVVDKEEACRVLMAHPYVLRTVEKLTGADFIPTWDSMVLKLPGEGIAVPWHRDAGTEYAGEAPIYNVDFYLDEADEATCVWLVPGSHRWTQAEARAEIERRTPFNSVGAIPALMHAGDVLLHNILVLHGSPVNTGRALRRVIYYEFRAASVEDQLGPHTPSYIPLKQTMLQRCLELRARCSYTPSTEEPFTYRPPAPYNVYPKATPYDPTTFRFAHSDYWRKLTA